MIMTEPADIELKINDSVLLSPTEPDGEQLQHSSYIQRLGEEWMSLPIPTHRGRRVRFTRGQSVRVMVQRDDALYAGVGRVLEVNWQKKVPSLKVEQPGEMKRVQRRSYFRWECSLAVRWHPVVQEDDSVGGYGTTVDISAGGLKLVVSRRLQVGEEYLFCVDLADEQIEAEGRVLRGEQRSGSGYTYAVQFTDIEEWERDKITRFIFQKQMKMRRKGLT